MSRLGRRSSFSGASRRCKSIPPLIGLLNETEPPAWAAHTPCTSGCPSASRAGGHGLATAGLAAPSPPCPATGIAADKMTMLIAIDSVRRRVLMCALLVLEGRNQLDVTLQRRAGVDGCQWEQYLDGYASQPRPRHGVTEHHPCGDLDDERRNRHRAGPGARRCTEVSIRPDFSAALARELGDRRDWRDGGRQPGSRLGASSAQPVAR